MEYYILHSLNSKCLASNLTYLDMVPFDEKYLQNTSHLRPLLDTQISSIQYKNIDTVHNCHF